MAIKIGVIGAGSIGFTRKLMHDILAVPELQDTIFDFMDLSQDNLDMVTQLCQRDIDANGLPAKIIPTTNQREAIADADYVLCVIRQGGLEAFALDIDIPLKYGVDQCVGDTICAGGIMYAQRTIPVLLDICEDIREVAKPDALFLNYSNPMAMNIWACNKYGGVPTIGLCHGVQGGHWQITRCIELWAKTGGPARPRTRRCIARMSTSSAPASTTRPGTSRSSGGAWTWCRMMLELFEAHPEYRETEKVRIDMLRRFGYYTTESNGHVSEYVPWYRKRPEEIHQLDRPVAAGSTARPAAICGSAPRVATGSRPISPTGSRRNRRSLSQERRSEEHGSYIIEGLETGRIYRGHFNVVNQGQITNLPDGCIIEIPGYVDHNGINMPVVGDLPLACAATCSASVRVQQMAMEAAVHGDVTLLKQAMLHDPLTAAVCNPEEIWQMTDEMLVAQAQWLPQYADSIPAAQARLDEAVANGTRVEAIVTEGAARLHTKTVEEMAADKEEARRNAAAADKGKMTKVV